MQPVKLLITGGVRVGQHLDAILYELNVKINKLIQGEFDDDLPRVQQGDDPGKDRSGASIR